LRSASLRMTALLGELKYGEIEKVTACRDDKGEDGGFH
jgi:hypothetical protein